ncbi:ABC-type sugar transport system, periplasmic component [Pleurocapsa sp. PCC 7327]|uniref:ABC transporter substrate-binding protein n=1 Tax=Pleurocapsa sp. PCC 7327 TaxID=118163 RepID=UPI00029FC021|nr:ABC transporter substrate-binding protein [Pleurocapsa sp. PCC 7327]AFY78120.1 ABC-type sugar transport system, periplasmic component [Pleurocapsa sp. PCC 7327]
MTTPAIDNKIPYLSSFLSKIKQFFLKWGSLLLIVFSLTACSQNTDGIITVTLSGWQSNPTERHLIEQVLKDFEVKHPDIKIDFEIITDQYMDVIKTRLIGDAAPDVFYLEAFEAPLLMSYGVLEPLDSYITAEFDLADFEPSLLEVFKYKGKLYGLPKDFSTLALFYNKQFFSQANLKTPPKTWQQLRKYSKRLTVDLNGDRRKDRYGLGITPELARQYFLMKAFGGELINRKDYASFATKKSVKGLKKIVEQYQKEQTAAQPSDVGASSDSEMFGQGKAAMVVDGNWAIPYLKETFPDLEFATAEVPSINGKKSTMAYTVAYVMNKKAKHKDAAWKLISYLTGKEGMQAWAKGGVVLPSRRSILSELGYIENPLYAPFIRGINYATIWQAGINLPTIRTHFNNQFLSALLGQQSLIKALQKAQKDANKEIQAADY